LKKRIEREFLLLLHGITTNNQIFMRGGESNEYYFKDYKTGKRLDVIISFIEKED